MTSMKNYLLPLLAAFLAASSVRAALITYTDTNNVTTGGGTTFTFSQFNSAFGTLSAIDLIINSSSPSGSITITNNAGTPMDVDEITARFRLAGNSTLGLSAYNTSYLGLHTTPSSPLTISGSGSQAFAIDGGQSFVGGSPVTRSISSAAFAQYLGSGTVSFSTSVQTQIDTTGADFNVSSGAFNAPTSMTLRYTYTPAPAPVPEPGQVAASLLLLGGIGTYFLIKRRRSSSASA
jgi:hypothetical protein